jgi:hypothetical protein
MDVCKETCTQYEYSLDGPQVEPSGGVWQFCPKLCIVGIEELTKLTDDPNDGHYFPPYPLDQKTIDREIAELIDLAKHRDDPCYFAESAKCPPRLGLCEFKKKEPLPAAYGCRRPASKLWNLCPYPIGGVLVNRFPGDPVVRTGRGLARAVESETPGIFHRHAATYLMKTRNWSPPRQALIWAALDVAIASALQAAWYYKWLARDRNGQDKTHGCTARRERPVEYTYRAGIKDFSVLYDTPDEFNPMPTRCPDSLHGAFSPGTPRHPAYPSGHSTYAAAASEILKFFFGAEETPEFLGPGKTTLAEEFDYLSDNIGLGRMWAGIHWRSDHEAGQRLGRTVACLILRQLANMQSVDKNLKPVPLDLCPEEPAQPCNPCDPEVTVDNCKGKPPSRKKLCEAADKIKCPDDDPLPAPTKPCKAPPECKGKPHPRKGTTRVDPYRGPQQGGGNP